MENNFKNENEAVLQAAYKAWSSAHALRSSRLRNKRFTYGDQWSDVVRDRNGRSMTEWQRYSEDGAMSPITNNVLRQLVKTIVGRFRSQHMATEDREQRVEQRPCTAQQPFAQQALHLRRPVERCGA